MKIQVKNDEGKKIMIQNEWPKIETNFYRNEAFSNYMSILTRIVGSKELFDSVKKDPNLYKLYAGERTMIALIQSLGRSVKMFKAKVGKLMLNL